MKTRILIAVAVGLLGPFLIGFGAHGLAFSRDYYPVAWGLWLAVRHLDLFLFVMVILHMALYTPFAFALLAVISTLKRRPGRDSAV